MSETMTIEVNSKFEHAKDVFESSAGLVALTPPLDGDYWLYRVKLKHGQSIIAFPKFFTIGCGFAQEDADWNTNLPISCDAEALYNHIKVNKGHKDITKAECIAAIKAIQKVVAKLPKEVARRPRPYRIQERSKKMEAIVKFRVGDRVMLNSEAIDAGVGHKKNKNNLGTVTGFGRGQSEIVWVRMDGMQSTEPYHSDFFDLVACLKPRQ